jgi:hypothetical protein
MDVKEKKFGLPIIAWVVIVVAVIAGLMLTGPAIQNSLMGSVKTPEQARDTIQDISTDVDDLGDILSDIDSGLG